MPQGLSAQGAKEKSSGSKIGIPSKKRPKFKFRQEATWRPINDALSVCVSRSCVCATVVYTSDGAATDELARRQHLQHVNRERSDGCRPSCARDRNT